MRKIILFTAVLTLASAGSASAAKIAFFSSPSGNVGCGLSHSFVRCDIAKHKWNAGHKPSSCPLDYGNGVFVEKHGKSNYTCAADTVLGQGPKAETGDKFTNKNFRCKIRSHNVVRCKSLVTGHGFKLSRKHVNFF